MPLLHLWSIPLVLLIGIFIGWWLRGVASKEDGAPPAKHAELYEED